MKCLVVVAFCFNIVGAVFFPNIKLSFKTLSEVLHIDYTIETFQEGYSPFLDYVSKRIILRQWTRSGRETFWELLQMHQNSINCANMYDAITFNRNSDFKENITFENNDQKWSKREVIDVFYYNNSLMTLPQFDGCKNTLKDDKLNENEIHLILFKNSEPIELTLWGIQFSVYSTMLGYIRFMNTATIGNTNEQNEAVFNDIFEYCQKVAKLSDDNYIPTFDHIYSDDIFGLLKNKRIYQIVILTIFVIMIILLIITVTCLKM